MAYLGLALFAEGPTDHRFLSPVLQRLVEQLCARFARAPVEVAPIVKLHSPASFRAHDRKTRILEAARESAGAWSVLFVHADGQSDPGRARRELVDPACAAIATELGASAGCTIAVVPVREMEAWALADGDALRNAFGTTLSDAHLGVPTPVAKVEDVADPKEILEAAWVLVARGRRHRRRPSASAFLQAIGERADLDVLMGVPAFAALREDVMASLRRLGLA